MKFIGAFVFAGFLGTAVAAYGSSFVIDSFSCTNSVSQIGIGDTNSPVSCPGAIGGFRQDTIFVNGGTGTTVSTLDSNPPIGAITGTIGTGLIGADVLIWGLQSGTYHLPNLDLSGDSILVQIESSSGGTFNVVLASSSVPNGNTLDYSATFSPSSSFEDLLIPLTNPTIMGAGANVADVTGIGVSIQVPGGGTWTVDGVEAVPEPSTLLLTGVCFIGLFTRSLRRRHPH